MNLSLLKKMLPGLIPLFVFILADEIWGTKIAGDIHLNSEQEKTMRKNMAAMFWITVVHVILVIYSALYMSKEA
jgi:hypothetical protein